MFLVMLTTALIILGLSLNVTPNKDDLATPDENKTEYSLPGTHKMYSRHEWGGREPLNFTKPLLHPAEYVIISHTAGRVCQNLPECSEMITSIQFFHMAQLRSPDIGYNFLIGGDANIYIGRGWDTINIHRNNTIGISFTGNFVYDYLTPDMISALKELLALGVQLNKIPPDYKLVCHNQTLATLSPGDHVYEEVAKFPNFYTGPIKFHD